MVRKGLFLLVVMVSLGGRFEAQDNYEIQVYGVDTVEPRSTMVEFHTNFTVQGSKTVENGVLPTEHGVHETIEITQGWKDWFELLI